MTVRLDSFCTNYRKSLQLQECTSAKKSKKRFQANRFSCLILHWRSTISHAGSQWSWSATNLVFGTRSVPRIAILCAWLCARDFWSGHRLWIRLKATHYRGFYDSTDASRFGIYTSRCARSHTRGKISRIYTFSQPFETEMGGTHSQTDCLWFWGLKQTRNGVREKLSTKHHVSAFIGELAKNCCNEFFSEAFHAHLDLKCLVLFISESKKGTLQLDPDAKLLVQSGAEVLLTYWSVKFTDLQKASVSDACSEQKSTTWSQQTLSLKSSICFRVSGVQGRENTLPSPTRAMLTPFGQRKAGKKTKFLFCASSQRDTPTEKADLLKTRHKRCKYRKRKGQRRTKGLSSYRNDYVQRTEDVCKVFTCAKVLPFSSCVVTADRSVFFFTGLKERPGLIQFHSIICVQLEAVRKTAYVVVCVGTFFARKRHLCCAMNDENQNPKTFFSPSRTRLFYSGTHSQHKSWIVNNCKKKKRKQKQTNKKRPNSRLRRKKQGRCPLKGRLRNKMKIEVCLFGSLYKTFSSLWLQKLLLIGKLHQPNPCNNIWNVNSIETNGKKRIVKQLSSPPLGINCWFTLLKEVDFRTMDARGKMHTGMKSPAPKNSTFNACVYVCVRVCACVCVCQKLLAQEFGWHPLHECWVVFLAGVTYKIYERNGWKMSRRCKCEIPNLTADCGKLTNVAWILRMGD